MLEWIFVLPKVFGINRKDLETYHFRKADDRDLATRGTDIAIIKQTIAAVENGDRIADIIV